MDIKGFLDDLSFMITDLEVKPCLAKQKTQMHKTLLRFYENLKPKEQKTHKTQYSELKERVLAINPIENQLLEKIASLKEDSDMFKGIIKVLQQELELNK